MLRKLNLVLSLLVLSPSLALAQASGGGPAPSTVGNSAGNPAYFSVLNNSGQVTNANPLQSRLTDGTQVVYSCTTACVVTNGGVIAGPIDTSGYSGLVVTTTDTGTGSGGAFETSADGTNWLGAACVREPDLLFTGGFGSGGNNNYTCEVPSRYFRIRATVYTSGTLSGVVSMKVVPQVSVTQVYTYSTSQYPRTTSSPAVPITASATGTTGATTATLAGSSGRTTYMCGFSITADATAFIVGTATVTGTITGTMSFRQAVGAVATQTAELAKTFSPCVPASAANTGIAVNSIAAGSSGNTAVSAWGYQL